MRIIELNPERRKIAQKKLARFYVKRYLKSLGINELNSKYKDDKKP
ncbi:hypothetical protein [Clostridium sp. YIM B02506]|nr:hypothetical protein [Clostridium sp. YIM B02506]